MMMIEERFHVLIIYGTWLYVRRHPLIRKYSLPRSGEILHENELLLDYQTRIGFPNNGYYDYVCGLLPDTPIQLLEFAVPGRHYKDGCLVPASCYDKGCLGRTELDRPTYTNYETINWSVENKLLIVRQSDHCWAELNPFEMMCDASDVILQAIDVLLPPPLGLKRLYVPRVQKSPRYVNIRHGVERMFTPPHVPENVFLLRYPFIKPHGKYTESNKWFTIENGKVEYGIVEPHSFSDTSEKKAKSDRFRHQLAQLFALLEGEGIFGCDGPLGASTWDEVWQIVASRVPEKMRKEQGWENSGEMLLCHSNTAGEMYQSRRRQASLDLSANDLHQNWEDRVDIDRMPLFRAADLVEIRYNAPDAAAKHRIFNAILKHAPAASLNVTERHDGCDWVEVASKGAALRYTD